MAGKKPNKKAITKTNMKPITQEMILGQTANWAKQTIAHAMGTRAIADGKTLDIKQVGFAGQEAHALTDELWQKATAKLSKDVPLHTAMNAYVKLVFAWCHNHMHPK